MSHSAKQQPLMSKQGSVPSWLGTQSTEQEFSPRSITQIVQFFIVSPNRIVLFGINEIENSV